MPKHQIKKSHADSDLAYMRSLSAAVIQRSPKHLMVVLGVIAGLFFVTLVWMALAKVDVVVRGSGKVIPARQVQQVQSLEGGVVAEILVREGALVEANQPLLKLSDVAFSSSFEENRLKYYELLARSIRLRAEAYDEEFKVGKEFQAVDDGSDLMPEVLESERSLYDSNKQQFIETLGIYEQQVKQAQRGLEEAQSKVRQLSRALGLVREEIKIKKPLVDERIISEIDFLQLRQREAELEGELEIAKISISRLRASIEEAKGKLGQIGFDFRNEAKRELNEVLAEISRIEQTQAALGDRVRRTTLRSPVKGVVMRLHANSIGGVVKPGDQVLEIVPIGDALLVEVKIKPADIALIQVDQESRLKFSAYDFAINGSLSGKVTFVSADTITDENGVSFYIVRVKPSQPYMGTQTGLMPIKVGMTSEADIVTGKKSILTYLLKPINRGMQKALTEN
ncbi:Type I secretion system membrane fusion protein PrsE [Zhongshania aliphaticivorans]|uniref:Membrane fusion protein (MFP) family protein n=1 Tax=Zhongshania aliphaticivorans TaxID=1470434 RepID=A0A5S9PRC6_9GAMM|nr:HlyD family type I secretion periplasmic adaptor subunit [Zhongshania aliphaticivorans]CAA0107245.1 Type I secretion system membrane fusion protein PrsE [Zhongshania aliphaticivorans]CAA0107317.1 Type I secretion system membrane fusion protein PrsE [Zhongshania aliphaticivorans]